MVIHSGEADPYEYEDELAEEDEGPEAGTAGLPAVFSDAPVRRHMMWWLIAALPIFGQTFHYMRDLMPLWAFSKAFPVISLPLVFQLGGYGRFPMTRQVLISFGWLVLVPSFAAIFYFHEAFFTSITAQVKLLPMLYFFSFLAFLLRFKPTLKEVATGFVLLGVVTSVVLVFLWALIPQDWYQSSYVIGTSPLFSNDNRGNRIRMPMYFPIIALFMFYRRGLREKSLGYLLGAAGIFAVTLLIVKTRAMVVGITGVMMVNTLLWSGPLLRVGLMISAPFALVGMFSVGYLATTFSADSSTGFDVRWITAMKAMDFLGIDPMRWIFGVGTISSTSSQNLMSFFDHFFFLADITWLGIVFEYGIIGAMLFLLFEGRAMLFYFSLRKRVEDDFLGALYDYIVYVLLISNLYPVTLTPGETAVILAIFVYVWHTGLKDDVDYEEAPRDAQA